MAAVSERISRLPQKQILINVDQWQHPKCHILNPNQFHQLLLSVTIFLFLHFNTDTDMMKKNAPNTGTPIRNDHTDIQIIWLK